MTQLSIQTTTVGFDIVSVWVHKRMFAAAFLLLVVFLAGHVFLAHADGWIDSP